METYRRSLYGASLQTAQLLGLPISIAPNTTLKTENYPLTIPKPSVLMKCQKMRYVSIGIGGHRG